MCTLNVIFISDPYKIVYMSIHKSGGNVKFFLFFKLLPNTIVNSVNPAGCLFAPVHLIPSRKAFFSCVNFI